MIVKSSKKFSKQRNKASKKIQKALIERLDLFQSNPFHSFLNFHKLQGLYKGYYSINITGDWRAIFKFQDEKTIILVSLNTHSKLYR